MKFLARCKGYIRELTTKYHDKGVLRGDIRPEHLLRDGTLFEPVAAEELLMMSMRHGDILLSGIATKREHDYYALFAASIYQAFGYYFNDAAAPVLNGTCLYDKVRFFMGNELKRLRIGRPKSRR